MWSGAGEVFLLYKIEAAQGKNFLMSRPLTGFVTQVNV